MTGGIAVRVVAVLVTWALHLAGWGKAPGVRSVGEWRMRERDRSARDGHPGCVGCRLAGRGRRVGGTAVTAGAEAVPERV
ncbi:hypothetical protein [Streptomyces sp. GQFP]|uniref:hypothetical protein n=1 Tax=Streptomyces sp. GQFP TaxID=2907545 RepID=UPI003FA75175